MADGWSPARLRAWSMAAFSAFASTACTTPDRPAAIDAAAIAPAAGGVEPAVASSGWPDAGSCAALVRALAALDAAVARELDPMAAPLVVTSLGADALAIGTDRPIPEVGSHQTAAAPCAILVGAPMDLPAPADTILDRRTVHSAYPTGTKRRRNPEHQALERDLSATKRGATGRIDVLATGDPLLDLIGTVAGGVIGGIGAAAKRSDVRAAEAALAATPAFIEDPILTPYRYDLVELEAERRLAVPVALYDRALGRSTATTVTLAERRRFAVVDGRHPNDAGPLHAGDATPVSAAELTAWRRAQPAIATSILLTHLAAIEPTAPGEPETLEAAMVRLASPAAATPRGSASRPTQRGNEAPLGVPAALAASVDAILAAPEPAAAIASMPATRLQPADLVRVGAADRAGFYVTPEHVLVPAEALGYSSLVVVRYPDGMRAHGLVELVDETLGLALVYLPRRGAALPLRATTSTAPATSSEPGLPWRDGESVIGVFVTDPVTAELRWIDSPTLDRFVAGLDAL